MVVNIQNISLGYLLAINIIAFTSMWIDKQKAKHNKWRIKERTLFLQALFGGSIGAMSGMYLFRHKTKHRSFVIGMPMILILQIAIVLVVFSLVK